MIQTYSPVAEGGDQHRDWSEEPTGEAGRKTGQPSCKCIVCLLYSLHVTHQP